MRTVLLPGKLLQGIVILAQQTCQLQHELYVLSRLYCLQDSKSSSKTTELIIMISIRIWNKKDSETEANIIPARVHLCLHGAFSLHCECMSKLFAYRSG